MTLTLRPVGLVTPSDLSRGLKHLTFDAVCSQAMVTFGAVPFLVAIALTFDASTLVVGMITALGPLMALAQLPGIYLVERVQRRKLLTVAGAGISRLFWIPLAMVPFIDDPVTAGAVFLLALVGFYLFGTLGGLAFNGWMRDLIPESIRGDYGGHRSAVAMAVGAVLAIALGYLADGYAQFSDRGEILSAYMIVAMLIGMVGCQFLARIPEPRMTVPVHESFWVALRGPLADPNYMRLIGFLAAWAFAVNLAMPFFALYMLRRLDLSLGTIMVLSMLALAGNVLFFRFWGRLADRFSNKSVLRLACPLFLVATALWPLSGQVGAGAWMIGLLVLIHLLTGIAMAATILVTANMAIKLAPSARSIPYLAMVGAVMGITGTLAPLIVGTIAGFGERGTDGIVDVGLAGFGLLDVAFVAAGALGAWSLVLLRKIDEPGDTQPHLFNRALRRTLRMAARQTLSPTGIVALFSFDYAGLAQTEPSAPNDRVI